MTDAETNPGLRVRYILTICAGSFLLFLVQPMIARMALPRLGGAPAVWNSAMLVYQALLLAGYAYAHWLGRFAPRTQAATHMTLFALAAFMLPIGLIGGVPSATANPFLWAPWLFAASIGPLFFMVAAQAPLMQRWFALSGGGDPYPLYAASNLGSFAGLIAYPLVVEPLLPLDAQSLMWTAGYAIVLILVGFSALALPKGAATRVEVAESSSPTTRDIVTWMALAAVPSGLMLSTSTHLTTDIVAMPLLWVVPLGLYLLSFSVAFATRRSLALGITSATPIILLAGGGTAFANSTKFPILFSALGLVLLFSVSVALHSKLYDRRPDPSRLTGFYLAMSAGGVLGGLFCALIAPVVFDWAYEHPILILAAALVLGTRPLLDIGTRLWTGPHTFVAGVAVTVAAMGSVLASQGGGPFGITVAATLFIVGLVLVAIGQRFVFAATLLALMLTLGGWRTIRDSVDGGKRTRSFFGIYAVGDNPGPSRYLVHGTTVHGLQSLVPGREREPLTYYAPLSGVGVTLARLPELYGSHARVGIVGLGAGTLACYAKPGQDWRFYEIDPAIAAIARDTSKFTYLSRCLPHVPVQIGDARIVLAAEPPQGLDVLVIDAFSSDAVPMHLLTREALETYRCRLAPNGLLLMHISNRFLDLEPVLAASQALGWHAMQRSYEVNRAEAKRGYATSNWIALASDQDALRRLVDVTGRDKWRPLAPRPGFAGWSDDYASILPLLKLWGSQSH